MTASLGLGEILLSAMKFTASFAVIRTGPREPVSQTGEGGVFRIVPP